MSLLMKLLALSLLAPRPLSFTFVPTKHWEQDALSAAIKLGEPVVMQNSPAASWGALQKWDMHYLASMNRLGHVTGYRRGFESRESSAILCPRFVNKNFSMYRCCNSSAICSGERITTTYDKLDAAHRGAVLVKSSLAFFSPKVYGDIPGWDLFAERIDRSDVARSHDSDLWVTTDGTVSAAHYDLQHNMYAVIRGVKRFALLPAEKIGYSYQFPYHHPRQRQFMPEGIFGKAFNYMDRKECADGFKESCITARGTCSLQYPRLKNISDTDIWIVELNPGDVLYIPPMWIHSGYSVGLSVSLGTCSPSHTEVFVTQLEQLPLPFEFDWNSEKRLYAILIFIDVTVNVFFPAMNSATFLQNVYENRYLSLFSDIEMEELLLDQYRKMNKDVKIDLSWNDISCSNLLDLISVRTSYSDYEPNCGNISKLYAGTGFEKSLISRSTLLMQVLFDDSLRFELSEHIMYNAFSDIIEQWVNFLLPELHTPLFFAKCRHHSDL